MRVPLARHPLPETIVMRQRESMNSMAENGTVPRASVVSAPAGGVQMLNLMSMAGIAAAVVSDCLGHVSTNTALDAVGDLGFFAPTGELDKRIATLCRQVLALGTPLVDQPLFRTDTSLVADLGLSILPVQDGDGAIGCVLMLVKPMQAGPAGHAPAEGPEQWLGEALAAARGAPFRYTAAADSVVIGKRPWACGISVTEHVETQLDDLLPSTHPDDRAMLRAALANPARGQETSCAYRILAADGSTHWYAMRGTAHFDADGIYLGTSGVFLDINADKKLEAEVAAAHALSKVAAEALVEQEVETALALRAARGGRFRYDIASQTLLYEQQVRSVFGFPPGDAPVSLDMAISIIVGEADRLRVKAAFLALDKAEEEEFAIEYVLEHPILGQRIAASMGRILREDDGAPRALVGIHVDLTAVRQQERNHADLARLVRIRNQKLTLALEAANAGWFGIDFQTGTASHVMPPALTSDGPNADNATPADLITLIHKEDLAKVETAVSEAFASETGMLLVECRLNSRAGGTWVSLRGQVERDAEGTPCSLNGILLDLSTERRNADERKLFLEAAAARDAELEMALSVTRSGIFRHDFRTRISNSSNSLRQIYALPLEPAVLYEDIWFERMHPDDSERVHTELYEAVGRRDPFYVGDYKIAHPSFGIRWISGRIHITYDEDGQPLTALGVHFDVSAQMERDQYLNLALEAAGAGYFHFDVATRSGNTSPTVSELIGLPKTLTISNAAWTGTIHPDDRESVAQAYRLAVAGQHDRLDREYRILHPRTGERWIDDRRQHLYAPDGSHLRSIGILFDITARKQREMELTRLIAESEEARSIAQSSADELVVRDNQLRMAFEAVRMSTFDFDPVSRIFGAGHPARAISGTQREVRFEQLRNVVHPEDWPKVTAAFDPASLAEQQIVSIEYRWLKPDQSIRWMAVRAQIIPDAQGKPARLVGITADVTEGKQREEAISESRQRLIQATEAARAISIDYDFKRQEVSIDHGAGGVPVPEGRLSVSLNLVLAYLHPEDKAALLSLTQETISRRAPHLAYDLAHPAFPPGLALRWFSLRGEIRYDDAGSGRAHV